jgi:hypothetical protein
MLLKHNYIAVAAIIKAAMVLSETRGLGHRLKNRQKSNEILLYLEKCRNAEDHPGDQVVDVGSQFRPTKVALPGIEISNSSVTFSDCRVFMPSGECKVLNGYVDTTGQVPLFSVDPDLVLSTQNADFILTAVEDHHGKTYDVPTGFGNDRAAATRFAHEAADFLRRAHADLEIERAKLRELQEA